MAEINFSKKNGIGEIILWPTVLEDYSQPRLANDGEAKELFERIGLVCGKRDNGGYYCGIN